MSFHPGQRVVCVDDSPYRHVERRWFGLVRRVTSVPVWLVKGRVYTISAVIAGTHAETGVVGVGVQLRELHDGSSTRGYSVSRFRPLSETRLDQFRAHLAPTPRVPVSA